MIRKLALAAVPAVLAATATPAAAAVPTTCSGYAVTVLTGWTACAGFYDANIFSNSVENVDMQLEAVNFLGGSYDGNFNALFGFPSLGDDSSGARTIQFGRTLTGVKIIGMHFGNIGTKDKEPQDYGNVSAFYRFNFGAGATSLTFVESRGLSNLYVFDGSAPVPEPSTWLLMIAAFGGIGAAMRTRRKQTTLAAA